MRLKVVLKRTWEECDASRQDTTEMTKHITRTTQKLIFEQIQIGTALRLLSGYWLSSWDAQKWSGLEMYLLEIWESFTFANEAFLMSFRKWLKWKKSLRPIVEKPPNTESWQGREGTARGIRVVGGCWHVSQDRRTMHEWRNGHQNLILPPSSGRQLEKMSILLASTIGVHGN